MTTLIIAERLTGIYRLFYGCRRFQQETIWRVLWELPYHRHPNERFTSCFLRGKLKLERHRRVVFDSPDWVKPTDLLRSANGLHSSRVNGSE